MESRSGAQGIAQCFAVHCGLSLLPGGWTEHLIHLLPEPSRARTSFGQLQIATGCGFERLRQSGFKSFLRSRMSNRVGLGIAGL
jgi:hypothetical protein